MLVSRGKLEVYEKDDRIPLVFIDLQNMAWQTGGGLHIYNVILCRQMYKVETKHS